MVGAGPGFHWFSKDHVAIIVVYDEEVGVAVAGGKDESTGGIGCDLTGDRFTGCKDVMRPDGVVMVGWGVGVNGFHGLWVNQ